MKFVSNGGTDRVLDLIRPWLQRSHNLDMVSESFSLFAFAELLSELPLLDRTRIVIPPPPKASTPTRSQSDHLGLLGTPADRNFRNRLQTYWLARQLLHWLENKAEVRSAKGAIPQGTLVLRDSAGDA
ncbi:helicase, partial [Ralstonia pseudosolanacearum]